MKIKSTLENIRNLARNTKTETNRKVKDKNDEN